MGEFNAFGGAPPGFVVHLAERTSEAEAVAACQKHANSLGSDLQEIPQQQGRKWVDSRGTTWAWYREPIAEDIYKLKPIDAMPEPMLADPRDEEIAQLRKALAPFADAWNQYIVHSRMRLAAPISTACIAAQKLSLAAWAVALGVSTMARRSRGFSPRTT